MTGHPIPARVFAPRRALSPTEIPSVAKIEQAAENIRESLEQIVMLHREALVITAQLDSSYEARGVAYAADPTSQAVMAQLVNSESDPADRWAPEHTTLRAAVESLISAEDHVRLALARYRSIVRLDERRGLAGRSRTYTAAEAESIVEDFDRRKRGARS